MSSHQPQAILLALKEAISKSKLRYVDIAERLGVSLPTVKRLLTKSDLPLNRLLEICTICGISLDELLQMTKKHEPTHTFYTDEQDKMFFEYPGAIIFFDELMEGKSVQVIQKKHKLSLKSTRKYLRLLEEHQLIEVWPGDKVKVLVKPPLGFGPNSLVLAQVSKQMMDYLIEKNMPKIQPGCYHFLKPLRLFPKEYHEMVKEHIALTSRYAALSESGRNPHPDLKEFLFSFLAAPAPMDNGARTIPELG